MALKPHHFHIPVMGTAFTIDTPIKVARFGISSVISISDDELDEHMREHYAAIYGFPFEEIKKRSEDYRARRIEAYLNLVDDIVKKQINDMKNSAFLPGTELTKYFKLRPKNSIQRQAYDAMLTMEEGSEKKEAQDNLRTMVQAGYIDVNIMTKLDKTNYDRQGNELPVEYSDAVSALRGYANSRLDSRVIFSAGFNRRLYASIPNCPDFFPDESGHVKKRIILKVSDYRSSLTQAKFLAKKGLWIDEHRIESGLNCGGHAFATDGFLMGPILKEFKEKKEQLYKDMLELSNSVLREQNKPILKEPEMRITVQGGIGTASEDRFLLDYYNLDGTGWATPFLLVPEVTVLDDKTRELLQNSGESEFFLSEYSPLGVPFNTVKNTASDELKIERAKTKPGSPCPKGHLVNNMEFTKKPICTASATYMRLKIKQLKELALSSVEYAKQYEKVLKKSCLCEDLAASSLITNNIDNKRAIATAVCPGPNMAYFDKISTLKDMAEHIYGKLNLLNESMYRPNMFIKELSMYIDYFKDEIAKYLPEPTKKNINYCETFLANLNDGIEYYKNLVPELVNETQKKRDAFYNDLIKLKKQLETIVEDQPTLFPNTVPALA